MQCHIMIADMFVCCLALLYIAPKAQNFVLGVSEVFCTVRTIIRTKHETCGLKVRKIFGLADILSEVLKKPENTGPRPGPRACLCL